MNTFLLVLFSPILIIDHCLSYLRLYRWLWGGHWERWDSGGPGNPAGGLVWIRVKKEACYRMTGKRPGALRGTPFCEEKGRHAYDSQVFCQCGRDLSRAPGVHGSYEDEDQQVFVYSCPCGRWPRFLMDAPVPLYLGDVRSVSNMKAPETA